MPWDTIGDSIRHRLRDPDDFKAGSFRYITLKKDKPRVFGIVGILKGETTTTLQALRFPIGDGWTVAAAKDWVKEHLSKSQGKVSAMDYETKAFRFEVKELDDAGQFTGYASVYGIVDSYGDIVEKGAFTKTIEERGGTVPVLWQHNPDEPVGIGTLRDSEAGLMIKGQLELELPEGQKTYIRLKKGLAKGLSIGYRVITEMMNEGHRLLKEIKLYEVSLVLNPANEMALVTSVKAAEPPAEPPDAYGAFVKLLTLDLEQKAGRTISAANMAKIRQIASLCNELLATDDTSTEGASAAKGVGESEQKSSTGPDEVHSSLLERFRENLRKNLDGK